MPASIVLPEECSRIVLESDAIAKRVAQLGEQVAEAHPGETIHLITVLRGGLFFLADLCRAMPSDVTLDFLAVAPYVPGKGGVVRVTKDLDDDIAGGVVVLVEDVVDTGLTVNYVLSLLKARVPRVLEVCALIDKPTRRIADVPVDYVGFSMSDGFLVGYGLDLAGRHRNLPFIAELTEEAVFG